MKRVGRFEFHSWIQSPTQGANVDFNCDITCDHANGDRNAYELPAISLDDARDLVYGLQQLIRNAEGLER